MLVPDLPASKDTEPDGTVCDSQRMTRAYWGAKDTRDDLDAEIQEKFSWGYQSGNILFERLPRRGDIPKRWGSDAEVTCVEVQGKCPPSRSAEMSFAKSAMV